MQEIEKLLNEDSGSFTPLRVGSRKFYRKSNGNFYPAGISKCIEKHQKPYVAIARPLIPIAIGSLDLRYPNWWLAVGIAERFCNEEKVKKHPIAKDLPPLILKYQPVKRLSFLFAEALRNEDDLDFALGRLYKLTVSTGLKVMLEKTKATLKDMLNLKKLREFILALRKEGFISTEGNFVIITQDEFDRIYKEIYAEEIKNWQKLKAEFEKQKAENETSEEKNEIAYKEQQENRKATDFKDIYSRYEESKEIEPPEDNNELPEDLI